MRYVIEGIGLERLRIIAEREDLDRQEAALDLMTKLVEDAGREPTGAERHIGELTATILGPEHDDPKHAPAPVGLEGPSLAPPPAEDPPPPVSEEEMAWDYDFVVADRDEMLVLASCLSAAFDTYYSVMEGLLASGQITADGHVLTDSQVPAHALDGREIQAHLDQNTVRTIRARIVVVRPVDLAAAKAELPKDTAPPDDDPAGAGGGAETSHSDVIQDEGSGAASAQAPEPDPNFGQDKPPAPTHAPKVPDFEGPDPTVVDGEMVGYLRAHGPTKIEDMADLPYPRSTLKAALNRLRHEVTVTRAMTGEWHLVAEGPDVEPVDDIAAQLEGTTRVVYEVVAANPGCASGEIQRQADITRSAVQRAMVLLMDEGWVQREGNRSTARYWTTKARDQLEADRYGGHSSRNYSKAKVREQVEGLLRDIGGLTEEAIVVALEADKETVARVVGELLDENQVVLDGNEYTLRVAA